MPHRVTLKEIAARAGVSVMTVSGALRNDPGAASAETRERIQKIAAELGYRPDPEMSRLMTYLRTARDRSFKSVLALVNTSELRDSHLHNPFSARVVQGAEERAAQLGYRTEIFWVPIARHTPAQVRRMLVSRGIRGIVILAQHPMEWTFPKEWEGFSCVSMTSDKATPALNCVGPDHAAGMALTLDRLETLGYRRIGLVNSHWTEMRTNHHWRAQYELRCADRGRDHYVPPLLIAREDHAGFVEWVRAQRPEVVVSADNDYLGVLRKAGLRVPQEVGFASLFCGEDLAAEISGVDQNARAIGAAAVDRLASQIERNESGLPKPPVRIRIEPEWHEGKTLRGVGERAKAKANPKANPEAGAGAA